MREKAVVLATGDFSANRDMMAKYCPAFAKFFDGGSGDYNVGFHERGLYRAKGTSWPCGLARRGRKRSPTRR
jgi:hypothetical protein